MNCKNCRTPIPEHASFCPNCGAKVVTQRITLKSLWQEFSNQFLGWDNSFFRTVKDMVQRPQEVIGLYINGTRKRYMAPITFIAFIATFSTLIFSRYSQEFAEMSRPMYQMEMEYISKLNDQNPKAKKMTASSMEENIDEMIDSVEQSIKSLNITTFLSIPIYALLSLFVFGKHYNYAEHLVANCYIIGTTLLLGDLLFLIAINTNPLIYLISFALTFYYYLFVFLKIKNKNSFGYYIMYFLKFTAVLLLLIIILLVFSFAVGYVFGRFL